MINDRPLPRIMGDNLQVSKGDRMSRVWRWGEAIVPPRFDRDYFEDSVILIEENSIQLLLSIYDI